MKGLSVRRRDSGQGLGLALNVILVFLVAAQLVYLGSRYRTRADLTAEKQYTLSESTRKVLAGLDNTLRLEAYFSPEEELTTRYQEARKRIRNFLDELARSSEGRVRVTYIDPLSDSATTQKARRIGIAPVQLRQLQATSASTTQTWQGLRMKYMTEDHVVRQRVIPFIPLEQSSPQFLEALITPRMKAISIEEKTRVAYMQWPYEPLKRVDADPRPEYGWQAVRNAVSDRYVFVDMRSQEGALVPEDIEVLVLFRPKSLTDRQQYVIDQHLMRGGTVLLFADTADFIYDEQRSFHRRREFAFDAPGGEVEWLGQLGNYGIELRPRIVSDLFNEALEPFGVSLLVSRNQRDRRSIPYPYFFHPVQRDWKRHAEQVAVNQQGEVEEARARRLRERLTWSIEPDHPLTKGMARQGRGPGLYFATPIGLTDPLPSGVEGEVLMRTSPHAVVEDPIPQQVDWLGPDISRYEVVRQARFGEYMQRYWVASRRQLPLMVEIEGTLTSAFVDAELPAQRGMEPPPRRGEGPGDDSGREGPAGEESAGEESAGENPDEEVPDTIGPQPAGPAGDRAKDREPFFEPRSVETSRIVAIGDSDFVRDDLVRGVYLQDSQRKWGPVSQLGVPFFSNVLDLLNADEDLLALRTRGLVDRTLSFTERDVERGESLVDYERRTDAFENRVRWFNILAPVTVLGLIGIIFLVRRRAQKRAFLARTSQLSEAGG